MAKPTPTKEEQGFVFQLGKDMEKIGFEIESLKNKTVKTIRIVVPGKPEKYRQYGLRAVISLPAECQHAICIKSKNGVIDLIETKETLSVYAEDNTSEFYLAPIYRLEAETISAAFDQEQMAQIESDVREREEREERERKEREEREERERKEREEREERKNREEQIYKYLAKWLTDNYLEDIRVKAANRNLEAQGINVYVNKNGLSQLLDKPFERNTNSPDSQLNESVYRDAKEAMLAEKARIDRSEVDLSVASDFNVVDYSYIYDWL
nr:MAG TPA: transcription initiation factor TFIID [Caudoviricetes sp.]